MREKKMLIIEGSDCLGKTTFAKLLLECADKQNIFPTYYSHMSRPNASFDFFGDYIDMMSTYAIQDRFHLGGIVWHHAIEQPALSIIEGWLRSIGSMTIILYASDYNWFRKRIQEDNRGNMLSINAMCAANKEYEMLANNCHSKKCIVDFAYDLTGLNPVPSYLDLSDAENIVNQWFDRLRLLETL